MERWKNVIWANVLVSGLLLVTLSACNSDEPAVTSTPAPSVAAAPDAAPIVADASPSPGTSPGAASPTKDSPEKGKPKDTTVAAAPKPLAATKPLVAGDIKPDKPLPVEDVKVKPVAETPKPELIQGGLSKSQMDAMKVMLDDTKKALDTGKMEDAKAKFGEFAGGPWEEAAKELKTKAATKHDEIDKAIKSVDAAGVDKAKFSKGLAEVIAALDKAKSAK
jgi:soluble cytochrome b562